MPPVETSHAALKSVRQVIKALLTEIENDDESVSHTLPHIKALPDPSTLEGSLVLERIAEKVKEQLNHDTPNVAPEITNHWLLSVPVGLRTCVRDVVNYLGMVVAIDFRHWAEEPSVPRSETSTTRTPSGTESLLVEREGARGGDMAKVVGFYTTVPRELKNEDAKSLHTETPSTGVTSDGPTLLRGSAAMIFLLKQAVEVHGVHWYDPAYLSQFRNDVPAARDALAVCFIGCREDGLTPLWMPATDGRVELLLSFAAVMQERRTSFYDILCESNAALFKDGGLIPRLIELHGRYHDWADFPLDRPSDDATARHMRVPILKLSQLTALALENALPALWVWQAHQAFTEEEIGKRHEDLPTWLNEAKQRVLSAVAQGAPVPPSLFADGHELSVCCDYQIPKALRDAGLLVYTDTLAAKVDAGQVLAAGGSEEVCIRVGALCAVERLVAFLTKRIAQHDPGRSGPSSGNSDCGANIVSAPAVDYALWYVGRYPVATSAGERGGGQRQASRHHLCRTMMY